MLASAAVVRGGPDVSRAGLRQTGPVDNAGMKRAAGQPDRAEHLPASRAIHANDLAGISDTERYIQLKRPVKFERD